MYCINLKHRPDRWERFSKQPELQELMKEYSFERFEGVNGANLNISSDDRISLRTKRNIREHIRRDHEELNTAGGVGCYLSHTTVWKKFLERPEPFCIIFEDDAAIPTGFKDRLHTAMKEVSLLPQVPDVWFFCEPAEWHYRVKGKEYPKLQGHWIQNVCTVFTGYLLTKRGAEKLLETAFPIDMHVDQYTCLANDIGTIFTAYNSQTKITSLAIKEGDTDIHLSTDCKICDVPTDMTKKGYVAISLPLVAVGVVVSCALGILHILKSGGSRRR